MKYIEVIRTNDNAVITRIEISNKCEKQIERLDNEMNRKIDISKCYTQVTESVTKLPIKVDKQFKNLN